MDAIATRAFRAIHRLIRQVGELLRIDTQVLCGIERRDTNRNADRLAIGGASPPEMAGETFGRMSGGIAGRVRHQNRELVASPPCSQISLTKGCVDGIGNAPYDAITGRVAPFVVDPF